MLSQALSFLIFLSKSLLEKVGTFYCPPVSERLIAVESNSLGPERASDPEPQVFPWMVTGQVTGQAFQQLCDMKALWVENMGAFFFFLVMAFLVIPLGMCQREN